MLETLADLMADASVLPDLFFNYDCDTQRTDVLESLTKALADAIKVRPVTDHVTTASSSSPQHLQLRPPLSSHTHLVDIPS